MSQNSINTSPIPYQLSGAKFVRIFGSNLPTGDNDLYTVPAGRKCLLMTSSTRVFNTSAGNINFFGELKVSGTYYKIGVTMLAATNTGVSANLLAANMVLNSGESFSVNVATNNGLNAWVEGIEFDANETKIITSRILGLSNGNNTLYTVSSGKSALRSSIQTGTSCSVINGSGGSLNYIAYQVPSGGTAGSSNQVIPVTALGAGSSLSTFVAPLTMASGDSVVLNTSGGGAGQNAWITMIEI